MPDPVRAVVALPVAFVSAFAVAFVVAPDPTGVAPLLVGTVLTAVFTPLVYADFGRLGEG